MGDAPLGSLLSEARNGRCDRGGKKTKKIWGGRASLVSHLVVGLELLSGPLGSVSPTLLLYNGRVVANAAPLDSETVDCAVEGLTAAGLDAVVVAPSSSITVPQTTLRAGDKLNPVSTTGGLDLIERWSVKRI